MRALRNGCGMIVVIGSLLAGAEVRPQEVRAHCDTMDGPVVTAAKTALAQGDVTPVLKWVKKEHEEEVRTALQKTLTVRSKGTEAKELADLYFFETVVRLHRAGEGEPYTGLKPAGTDPGPAVKAGDQALEDGSVEQVVKLVTDTVAAEPKTSHSPKTQQEGGCSHGHPDSP